MAISERASQYRPELVQGRGQHALERTALKEGIEVQDGATKFRIYRSETPVGWDGGKPTHWIRAEMTSGDIFHGHPMSIDRVRKYVADAQP